MDTDEYELFEHLAGGPLNWHGLVRGLCAAQVAVWLLADDTGNECFAMNATGNQIALARTPLAGAKRIFQIAYGEALATRAHLLHRDGYDVTSVAGNEAAQLVLYAHPPYNLFVIGHAAAAAAREEMAVWLGKHYPSTRIVALNACGQALHGLRYNASSEPVAAWLPLISTALARTARSVTPPPPPDRQTAVQERHASRPLEIYFHASNRSTFEQSQTMNQMVTTYSMTNCGSRNPFSAAC